MTLGTSQDRVKNILKEYHVHRTGLWLPADHRHVKDWISDIIEHVDKNSQDLHPHTSRSRSSQRGCENWAGSYLTATATRVIIFIETGDDDLELVCFLGIGMTEVSTCDITVKQGDHVKKGDQLGMFHYDGSTHYAIFQKGVELEGFPSAENSQHNIPMQSKLAVVKKR
ncbi:uncharacterized protein M421DRAFT_360 [Didymella exigua CBS 183.55]|uniref:Uncharacterized protein n=1 Tax=Didymella exigua CBS 183.55 TaxID=1150837 RepID=A0A6A5S2S4_9PLEO|nr:uncharacterized protein M421DRAFT_360 [Didymella exigua CBS 183.55]KAF1934213.1 hypothetical protein M421DRAFT_360 [Didymella exigua CBS 183.55]